MQKLSISRYFNLVIFRLKYQLFIVFILLKNGVKFYKVDRLLWMADQFHHFPRCLHQRRNYCSTCTTYWTAATASVRGGGGQNRWHCNIRTQRRKCKKQTLTNLESLIDGSFPVIGGLVDDLAHLTLNYQLLPLHLDLLLLSLELSALRLSLCALELIVLTFEIGVVVPVVVHAGLHSSMHKSLYFPIVRINYIIN